MRVIRLETKARMKDVLGTFGDFDPEDSKNNYPVNEDYHLAYEEMVKANEWDDSPWDIGESKKTKCISGSSWMWNGSIEKLREKIGIDPGAIEIINHGHMMVHMATHPEAVKYHLWRHGEWIKQFNSMPDELREMEVEFGHAPYSKCPYVVPDEEFEAFVPFPEEEVAENGEPLPLEPGEGVLELHPNGYGFLRNPANNYQRERSDPFVPGTMVERFGLREGVMIRGLVQQNRLTGSLGSRQDRNDERAERSPRRTQSLLPVFVHLHFPCSSPASPTAARRVEKRSAPASTLTGAPP